MGDMYEADAALADDAVAAGQPADDFDSADEFDSAGSEEQPTRDDPMRPEAKRGRYTLPNPLTGKAKSWMRVSNLIKKAENTYHLELWKQRNVAKGLAMRPDFVEAAQGLEVKADKDRLNRICERAQEIAGAYKMSDEGTALHKSTELADFAGGSVAPVKPDHQVRVQLYLDALKANGLTIPPGMIERVIVSQRYDVAGKFDRIYQLGDGSYVIGDLKTSDSLDLSFPAISAQLACYQDGVNSHGIWDGSRYDDTIKVRTDFALVVHLPSTRNEVTVYRVSLDAGHELNRVCVEVRESQKVKAKHVAAVFQADAYRASGATAEQDWLITGNACHTVDELMGVADRARFFGQYTERLANQFRILARELAVRQDSMGS